MYQDRFKSGDIEKFTRIVRPGDLARFGTDLVHPLYSTFALARDAEWTCRQFVIQLAEADEEGMGTAIQVNHKSPAAEGSLVEITATLRSIHGNEITCDFTAICGNHIIATGYQVQKILKKEAIHKIIGGISE
jgi:fluoroacetyl-CoA thioesterase